MKHYKNDKKELFAFDLDCFDEKGNCINEYALKVIEENNLVEITTEEAEAIKNYKTAEQIAEEERLAKLPSQEQLQRNTIELVALDLIMSMKEEGIL